MLRRHAHFEATRDDASEATVHALAQQALGGDELRRPFLRAHEDEEAAVAQRAPHRDLARHAWAARLRERGGDGGALGAGAPSEGVGEHGSDGAAAASHRGTQRTGSP